MIRIRLRRVGAKKQPSYRIVVADSRSPRDGRFIEKIGFYNPRTEPATMEIDEGRALYWLSKGAQPSEPVHHILRKTGTLARYERLRSGEALEILIAEAASEVKMRGPIDRRTRRDDLMGARATATRARANARPATVAATAVMEAEAEETEAEAEIEQAAEGEELVAMEDETAEDEADSS